MCAAGAAIQSDPAGNRKLNKAKSHSKIDGLVALAMALRSMSADEIVSATSPLDDPKFKLAVSYQWFPTMALTKNVVQPWIKAKNTRSIYCWDMM